MDDELGVVPSPQLTAGTAATAVTPEKTKMRPRSAAATGSPCGDDLDQVGIVNRQVCLHHIQVDWRIRRIGFCSAVNANLCRFRRFRHFFESCPGYLFESLGNVAWMWVFAASSSLLMLPASSFGWCTRGQGTERWARHSRSRSIRLRPAMRKERWPGHNCALNWHNHVKPSRQG
jgi:hypothetical protein